MHALTTRTCANSCTKGGRLLPPRTRAVRDLGVGPCLQSPRAVLGLCRRESSNLAPEARPQAPEPRHATVLARARESFGRCFFLVLWSRWQQPKQQGRLRKRPRQQWCRRKRSKRRGFGGPRGYVRGVCGRVLCQWRHGGAVTANCYGNTYPSHLRV